MYFVSACLVGMPCRFDGGHRRAAALLAEIEGKKIVFECPEQLGGLPTPRCPAEIVGGTGEDVLRGKARVVNERGEDVTACFLRGAEAAAALAERWGLRRAFLKARSPSCGVTAVKRKGNLVPGRGVTAALLARRGIDLVEVP